MEEALLKPFADPDGTDGESARVDFDDVDDYDGLSDDGARDQLDTALTGLEQYDVSIEVEAETISGVAAKRVDVEVTHSSGSLTRLSGYRTNY
jgi:MSHA pilin protein MshD